MGQFREMEEDYYEDYDEELKWAEYVAAVHAAKHSGRAKQKAGGKPHRLGQGSQ